MTTDGKLNKPLIYLIIVSTLGLLGLLAWVLPPILAPKWTIENSLYPSQVIKAYLANPHLHNDLSIRLYEQPNAISVDDINEVYPNCNEEEKRALIEILGGSFRDSAKASVFMAGIIPTLQGETLLCALRYSIPLKKIPLLYDTIHRQLRSLKDIEHIEEALTYLWIHPTPNKITIEEIKPYLNDDKTADEALYILGTIHSEESLKIIKTFINAKNRNTQAAAFSARHDVQEALGH